MHSVVPHHHHHEELTEHHDATGHAEDDHDTDADFLGNAFSFLHHGTDGATVYESGSLTFKCTKVKISNDIFFQEAPVIKIPHKPPLVYEDHTVFRFTSSFNDALQLRGPPVPMG